MSFAGSFRAIAARYGQTVTVYRNGEMAGKGRAVLRPIHNGERQFVPTVLGGRQRDTVLCLGEGGLPLDPGPEEIVVRQGGDVYDVLNVRPIAAGDELICWRAILVRRDVEQP